MGTLPYATLPLIIIVAPLKMYSEQANRGQNFQIFGCFWPLPAGHVTQRTRNGHIRLYNAAEHYNGRKTRHLDTSTLSHC